MTKRHTNSDAPYSAIIEKTAEGGYVAQCVEIPLVIAQGETLKEVMQSIELALDSVLKAKRMEAEQQVHSVKNHSLRLEPIPCLA